MRLSHGLSHRRPPLGAENNGRPPQTTDGRPTTTDGRPKTDGRPPKAKNDGRPPPELKTTDGHPPPQRTPDLALEASKNRRLRASSPRAARRELLQNASAALAPSRGRASAVAPGAAGARKGPETRFRRTAAPRGDRPSAALADGRPPSGGRPPRKVAVRRAQSFQFRGSLKQNN